MSSHQEVSLENVKEELVKENEELKKKIANLERRLYMANQDTQNWVIMCAEEERKHNACKSLYKAEVQKNRVLEAEILQYREEYPDE